MRPYRSVYDAQEPILEAIHTLHVPVFECDATFGNGAFWKSFPRPKHCFDLQPLFPFVRKADACKLPLKDSSIASLMLDPPFLTYVRNGREGNGKMVMSRRFAGYWTYGELEQSYKGMLTEASRVLAKKGKLVFKCQDIIHNHRMHCTHARTIAMAESLSFRLRDLFVLEAKHRLPAPNRRGSQKHARIFHSYFLVFEKR